MTNKNFSQTLVWFVLLIISTMTIQAHNHQQIPEISHDGTLRRIRVPILMYHYVSELPPNADDIRIGLTVSQQLFREHMQYLHSQGYTTISLYDLHLALEQGATLPSNPVILTFDDGYIDHYTTVFPILREYNQTGTFFIVTDFADNNRGGYMSWEQITEMANAGMSIEPHTKTHADLRQRDYDFLVFEILGGIESIEQHTGIRPRMFAYPIGNYDDNTLEVISTTDILRALTTQTGTYHTTDNRLLLTRLRVSNNTTIPALQSLLKYGY